MNLSCLCRFVCKFSGGNRKAVLMRVSRLNSGGIEKDSYCNKNSDIANFHLLLRRYPSNELAGRNKLDVIVLL